MKNDAKKVSKKVVILEILGPRSDLNWSAGGKGGVHNLVKEINKINTKNRFGDKGGVRE